MKKFNIPNTEIQDLLKNKDIVFPKYSTQLMNLANQNSQATRKQVVGQMSELIQEFDGDTLKEWEDWYLKRHPDSISEATKKVYDMILNFKEVIVKIDEQLVRDWIEELIFLKTFAGLKFQEAILKKLSIKYNKKYRLALPEEESKGIDGYLDDKAISIKPDTYKSKLGLNETIEIPIVFYTKGQKGVKIEFDESILE